MTISAGKGTRLLSSVRSSAHHKIRKLYRAVRGIVEFKPVERVALGSDFVDDQSSISRRFVVASFRRTSRLQS